MPIRHACDHAADPHALRQRGHRAEEGPALEDRAGGAGADRVEMVEVPDAVEARIVGQPPDVAQVFDRAVLRRELEVDADHARSAMLPALGPTPAARYGPAVQAAVSAPTPSSRRPRSLLLYLAVPACNVAARAYVRTLFFAPEKNPRP